MPIESFARLPAFKVLVIDESDTTATTIASVVARGSCEIISCRDMALAEVAIDLTDFDLILVAPDSTGVNGVEGLAVADFFASRNPRATTVLMLAEEDADLRAMVEQTGAVAVLSKPLLVDEFIDLSGRLGIRLATPQPQAQALSA